MILTAQMTHTYSYDDQYSIDITFDGETYEAWLYNNAYGVKDLMFGCPVEQQSFDYFLDMVENSAPEYIETYKDQYED